MGYETILLDKKGHVATITLNRPDRLNAWNGQMHLDLADVFETLGKDEETRVVVLTGAGRAFCSGADIKGFQAGIEMRKAGKGEGSDGAYGPRGSFASLARLEKPIIAAINGYAVGIGCTVTLACDIRIASEAAQFLLPFTRLGILPEFGSTYTLPRLIGMGKACELLFTCKTIGAQEAKEIGLVNQVVPADQLMAVTYEMANSIAKLPPLAMKATKIGLYQGLKGDLESQLNYEVLSLSRLRSTEDHEEATKAFLEKREPHYKGR